MLKAKECPVIPDEEVVKRLEQELPGWYLDGRWIKRKHNSDGWPTTLMLVNTIAYLAEAAWHHPDLEVTWGKVWVKLRTHAAGGITEKDLTLAKQIEQSALWRPDENSPLDGTPNKWVRGGSKE